MVCSFTHVSREQHQSAFELTQLSHTHTVGLGSEQWTMFQDLFRLLPVCSLEKGEKDMLKVLCSVGGQCTERAYVSWLIVGGGFGGHCVFHNDMEQLLDMHARGHPALSLLIPDSSFSPDPRRNLRRGGWGYDQRRVDGPPHTHTHAHVLIDHTEPCGCPNLLSQICFGALKLFSYL